MLDELPDAKPENAYWTLAQLVNRRDNVVIEITRLKNQLHEQLVYFYPSYKKLASELRPISHNQCSTNRAKKILNAIALDGNTKREHQEVRDFISIKLVKDLEHKNGELVELEIELEKMMKLFDCKLTSISGVDRVTAAKLLAEIGDINRFSNANKLARFVRVLHQSNLVQQVKAKKRNLNKGNERYMGSSTLCSTNGSNFMRK